MSQKKFLFYCNTPFQLMGAVNFVCNNVEGSKNNSDLFIDKRFVNAEEICEKIKNLNIFNNVYDATLRSLRYGRKTNVFFRQLELLKWSLFTRDSIQRITGTNALSYDIIIFSFINSMSEAVCRVFPNAEIVLLDDGVGSYYDGGLDVTSSKNLAKRIFFKHMMKNTSSGLFKRLYVNNTSVCKNSISGDIRQLPKLTSDENSSTIKMLYNIFDYKDEQQYKNHRFVYLTQPLKSDFVLFSLSEFEKNESGLLNKTNGILQKDLIVRVHPRQPPEQYNKFNCDKTNNIWELECIEEITENHVLISLFSTAQITPKILFETEPYIIFTYKLLPVNFEHTSWKGVSEFIENKLIPFYSNPEKIFIPETAEEFYEILRNLNKEIE